MQTGYPRFFIHLLIQELQLEILAKYGLSSEKVMLFPSRKTAERCRSFFHDRKPEILPGDIRLLHLEVVSSEIGSKNAYSNLSCVFFPSDEFPIAKQVWQHTGDGVSSRRAEYCLAAMKQGFLSVVDSQKSKSITTTNGDPYVKGPRRYQRGASLNNIQINGHVTNGDGTETPAYDQFIEERYGRNLNTDYSYRAKVAVRRRIAGVLTDNMELDQALAYSDQPSTGELLRDVPEDDVYLYPTGMSAIFNAHQLIMETRRSSGKEQLKSICFGFPYIDTLKVLEKWGPGAKFYGNGIDEDLDDLETRLEAGERFAALFTEFPSNPLLRSPNLSRIRQLADKYDFVVVVDETVGNYININVLQHVDIVVSSLTKVFTGECNVMGGSLVLNKKIQFYQQLKIVLDRIYEDNYWAEDAVFMERNSRDFVSRIERININADSVARRLQESEYVKEVYYPSLVPSKKNYDACKTANGGYGGLLSVTFHSPDHAPIFFDNLNISKGPSLGTNFSLSCPFVILAHYTELDWVRQFGVDPYLVRISVGLESPRALQSICDAALDAVRKVSRL